jgi:hypothetical protein
MSRVDEKNRADDAPGHITRKEITMKGNPGLPLAALIGAACSMLGAPNTAVAQTLPTHRVPAALALEAVGEAVAACARQGYAETAVLVDADGVRQAVLRGDWAGAHTLDSAFDKAYTSASFKTDTGALVEHAKIVPIAPVARQVAAPASLRRRRRDQDA